MPPKTYIETSFIGYLASQPTRDELTNAHQRLTREWWDRRRSLFELYIQPGRWRMTALITTGTTMQAVRGDAVEIEPATSKQIDVTFKPLVFHGRVTMHGRGVKGNLDVIGSQRTDIVPSVPTSETGELTALLQRADTCQAGVRTREPMRALWAGDVDFTDPARFIEIVVPDNQIIAAVRSGGQPVRNVAVRAQSIRDGTGGFQSLDLFPVTTDGNGEAALDGILPGTWRVTAEDEGGRMADRWRAEDRARRARARAGASDQWHGTRRVRRSRTGGESRLRDSVVERTGGADRDAERREE